MMAALRVSAVLWLGGLLLSALAHAQTPPPSTHAHAPRFSHGLLWKIEKPGRPASYLFGTLHVSDEKVLALPDRTLSALKSSRLFAGEIRLDEAGPELAAKMRSDEPVLPRLLGEHWDRVRQALATRGIPPALSAQLQPWAALILLLKPIDRGGEVLDAKLQRLARENRLPVIGLETAQEQIESIANLPQPTQIALLRHAAQDTDTLDADIADLTEGYLAGDLGRAWQLETQKCDDAPELKRHCDVFIEALLTERNRRLVARAQPLLDKGGVFIAVGALHLVGETGMPALLEQAGFTLKRAD